MCFFSLDSKNLFSLNSLPGRAKWDHSKNTLIGLCLSSFERILLHCHQNYLLIKHRVTRLDPMPQSIFSSIKALIYFSLHLPRSFTLSLTFTPVCLSCFSHTIFSYPQHILFIPTSMTFLMLFPPPSNALSSHYSKY